MELYLKLIGTSLIPFILSVIFYLLKRKTAFGNIKRIKQEIIIGVVFGIYSICSTEFLGVVVNYDGLRAVCNARDAGPLCAGLFFGGPAGAIAGLIGGLERLISGLLGKGSYTTVACSVSTFLAGLFAWWLRKYMLDNKRPPIVFATMAGIITEVVHLTLVFVTHLNDPNYAMEIVKICTLPMILANGLALLLSSLAITIISKIIHLGEERVITVSQQIQKWLLIVVLIAYLLTTTFVYTLETNTTNKDVNNLLSLNISDISNSSKYILNEEKLDTELIAKAHIIKDVIENNPTKDLNEIATEYDITEINIVDSTGDIVSSTHNYEDYNMYDSPQSTPFMDLITNDDTFEVIQSFTEIGFDGTKRKYAGVKLSGNRLVQIGYDEEDYINEIVKEFDDLVTNRHISQDGQLVILYNDGSTMINNLGVINIDELTKNEEMSSFKININDEKYLGMYEKLDDIYICGFISVKDAYKSRNNALYINSFMEVIVFGILFVITYILVDGLVVKNLKKVNKDLALISDGNLDVIVDVDKNIEFIELSTGINVTVDALKKYIKEAETRIDKELALAKSIQTSALPSIFPAFPNIESFDIYAFMHPAKEVGGDFYDFYMLDSSRLAFVIADVSGKGIPAAMFMMRSKTLIKTLAERGLEVNEILSKANNSLCSGNEAEMFVTCWMGILDLDTGKLSYSNAGHNPPLIYRNDVGYEYLKSSAGLVLAGLENIKYKYNELTLNPGDRLFLYTDGVVEATNINNELYGDDRLLSYLNTNNDLLINEVINGIKVELDSFAGEREQFDDITMLSVVYFGKK